MSSPVLIGVGRGDIGRTLMKRAGIAAVLLLISVSTSAAEVITLECKPDKKAKHLCPSHWVIDGDAKTVTWHWCNSSDTTEPRNVVITGSKITFREDSMKRDYEFDRTGPNKWQMWIEGTSIDPDTLEDGPRYRDPDESVCRSPTHQK
jgi:hypothetical protein